MTNKLKKTYYKRPTGPWGEFLSMLMFPLCPLKRSNGFDLRIPALNGRNCDSIRVEVKTAQFTKKCGWQFNFTKRMQHVWGDWFLLIALDPDLNPAFMLRIPREKLTGIKNLWIGEDTFDNWSQYLFV